MNAAPSQSTNSQNDRLGLKAGFLIAAGIPAFATLNLATGDSGVAQIWAAGTAAAGIALNVAATRFVKHPIAKLYSVVLSIPVGMGIAQLTGHPANAVETGLLVTFASAALARGIYVFPQQLEKFKDDFDKTPFIRGAVAGMALSGALALGVALTQEPVSFTPAAGSVPAPARP